MKNMSIDTDLRSLFSYDENHNTYENNGIGSRSRFSDDHFSILFDKLSDDVCCAFIRSSNIKDEATYKFSIQGKFEILAVPAGGWVVRNSDDHNSPDYWIPVLPKVRKLDNDLHITNENSAEITGLSASTENISISIKGKHQFHLDLIVLQFKPTASHILDQLITLDDNETAPVFLWGSHTLYTKPADLFLHLIYGFVYENRTAWPFYRKICSENDAHALYVTLSGLNQTSGKSIYGLLKRLIIIATISRQGTDGAWRHGEWSDDMEAHFRLHCSGMHLLMDALSEEKNQTVEDSLKNAASFISRQRDNTNIGTWFLHDELELSEASMRKSPFKWVRSKAFGKSLSNMLVLNTHLDTTIALDRYATITGDQQYCNEVISARHAVSALLDAKPAESLYRLIFRIIELTLLPTEQASKLPAYVRIFKRLGWKYLIPNLQHIKKIFPRINMPSGYIDRALSLKGISPAYQSINTMDLARYMRRFPDDLSLEQTEPALEFSNQQSFRDYLAESDKTQYALGFWAETLYHLCTITDDAKYRQWLADTIIDLDRKHIGLPPSILGGNMEVLSSPLPSSATYNAGPMITVANLSYGSKTEFLLVNTGPAPETIEKNGFLSVMSSKEIETMHNTNDHGITLAPGSWVSIQPTES